MLRTLAAALLLAALAHAAPPGGGFAVGDIWMNLPAVPGMISGGLVRIDPLTGTPHMVLPYSSSNAVSDTMGAFCYDPVRDRILVQAAIDGQPSYTFWQVDAAGNHSKANVTIGGVLSMAPAPDGKVYVALAGFSTPGNPFGVLGWLDQAGAYHVLTAAGTANPYNPFANVVQVITASLAYDDAQHELIYAVSNAGSYCKSLGNSGKGGLFRIALSADGTQASPKNCDFYDMDDTNGFGTLGGIPRGFSRAPGGAWMLVFSGAGKTNSLDEAAPRIQMASPGSGEPTFFASNGPYPNAAWSTAGVYSSVRHQAVIFDGANNRLRAYDAGESGDGDVLADGLVGGTIVAERAGMLEIQPHGTAQGSLIGTPGQVSIATGGTQTLAIDFGPAMAGKIFLVLGSASGFTPGFALKGWSIPLNFDAYTQLTLEMPNGFLVANSYGVLDGAGKAQAQFTLPPGAPAALAGLVLHHAAIAAQGGSIILGVSNAAPVTLVP